MAEEDDKSKLVEIDEENLDLEWVKQPKTVYRFAIALANARLEHARAKANLDVVAAELAKRVRAGPQHYHIDKVTESTVEGAVLMSVEHKAAMELMNKAKWKMDMHQAMIDALEHKKRGLENLVTLHGQNYFSSPRATAENQQAMDRTIQKKVSEKTQKARK